MDKVKPKEFYTEVKEELNKVTWPSKEQTIQTSLVVLVLVVILTVYLGVVDAALARIVTWILG